MIYDGEVTLTLEWDNKPLTLEWGRGFVFGEYSVFSEKAAGYTFKSKTKVKMFALPNYKFMSILSNYEDILKVMRKDAFDRQNRRNIRFQRKFKEKLKEEKGEVSKHELETRWRDLKPQYVNLDYEKVKYEKILEKHKDKRCK